MNQDHTTATELFVLLAFFLAFLFSFLTIMSIILTTVGGTP